MNNYPHFPRPVIEAWSMKKAVIVNDDKYSRYLISDGIDGIRAKAGDLKDWIDKCNILLNNAELRIKIGNNGNKKFCKNYCEEKVISDMHNIFKKI